ncbi:MAG: D-2-hydroxyacid dehydrogenase [Clostridiales bacterium]|nr:D-2-hydroxyacid dehydrogenase [Clostridiales bacterium]
MKIVVLDGFAVNPGDLSWDFLNKYGEVEIYAKTPDAECAEKCVGAEVVYTNRARITAELLDACPTIKYVSALGTGYDMIDIAACRSRGVAVVNIPAYSTASVAQLTIQFLLALYSDLDGMRNIVREGKWTGMPGYRYQSVAYTELASLTLGLVGCGGIGGRVAEVASALGMRVLAATEHKHDDTDCVKFVTLDRLLAESDVISLHCPLTDATRGMVDARFISKMKPGAKLINTSRGAVINEADVAEALNSGRLGGAALDVLAVEPALSDNPLLSAKNCMITPHIAWASRSARERLLCVIEASLDDYVRIGVGLNRIV